MINENKLIDAAVDLRIATLRAKEQGIIGYQKESDYMTIENTPETFQIYDEEDYKTMIQTREYTIRKLEDRIYKYQYMTKVAGLNFICITPYLFSDEDKKQNRKWG